MPQNNGITLEANCQRMLISRVSLVTGDFTDYLYIA